MTQEAILDIGAQSVIVMMKIAAPILLSIMVTGFLVSIFQAATQINEQTLSFIPKIMAMTATMAFAGPWILQTVIFFTKRIFDSIPAVTH